MRKSEVFELTHTNICKPIKVKTFSGCSYFIIFIDDAFTKMWAYALKRKRYLLDIFKSFHVAIKREIGKLLKCLRSDNGGEYSSIDFDDYCSKYDIRYEKNVPYSL